MKNLADGKAAGGRVYFSEGGLEDVVLNVP